MTIRYQSGDRNGNVFILSFFYLHRDETERNETKAARTNEFVLSFSQLQTSPIALNGTIYLSLTEHELS